MSVYGLGGFHSGEILGFPSLVARFPDCGTERPPVTRQRPVAIGCTRAPIRLACDGQGLVEFAFILMLVALACVASVVAFGTALDGYYAAIISALPF